MISAWGFKGGGLHQKGYNEGSKSIGVSNKVKTLLESCFLRVGIKIIVGPGLLQHCIRVIFLYPR